MTQQKLVEVLLIEDTAEDADLITQTLKQSHPDVAIKRVHDGAEALDCLFGTGQYLDRATPYTPHLILLDLKLPKVSGLEVLRIIKSYARTRVIPIIIFTDSPQEQKVVEGYQLGANSFVMKPNSLEQFREVVKQIGAYWLEVNRLQEPDNVPESDDSRSTPS